MFSQTIKDRINGWGSILRFITPILVTISIFIIGQINTKVDRLDSRMYEHFINSEVHIPRTMLTLKGDFDMYVNMRNKQWDKLYDTLSDINNKQDKTLCLLLEKK
jgi:hypothetical protein